MKGIRFDGARTGALPNLSHLIYLRPQRSFPRPHLRISRLMLLPLPMILLPLLIALLIFLRLRMLLLVVLLLVLVLLPLLLLLLLPLLAEVGKRCAPVSRMPDRVFTPFRHTTRTSGQIISKCVPHPADTSPGHGSVKDFLKKYWTSGTPAPSMEPVDVHRRDKGQGDAFCSRAQPAPFCKKGRSKRRAKMRPSSTRQGHGQGSCIARPPQAQTSSQGGWVRRALNFRACGRLRLSPQMCNHQVPNS